MSGLRSITFLLVVMTTAVFFSEGETSSSSAVNDVPKAMYRKRTIVTKSNHSATEYDIMYPLSNVQIANLGRVCFRSFPNSPECMIFHTILTNRDNRVELAMQCFGDALVEDQILVTQCIEHISMYLPSEQI